MKRGLLFFFLGALLLASDVRPYLQTGPWYPADTAQLQKMLDGFFGPLPSQGDTDPIVGIIAPHAGYAYSGLCAARAYRHLAGKRDIRRVLLLGSSHQRNFYGACVSDHTAYATPLGTTAVDTGICRELAGKKFFQSDRGTMTREHSIENQLPFLQRALGHDRFTIVPILFGRLDKRDFAVMAETLARLVDAHTLVVASSDLTHYGQSFAYTPFRGELKEKLTALDHGLIETIERLDFDGYWRYREKTAITACGFVPMGVMIRLFTGQDVACALAAYAKSGDRDNDYSTSVSYASLLLRKKNGSPPAPAALDRREQKMLLDLARSTLADHFRGVGVPGDLESRFSMFPNLCKKSGVFVTLRRNGELRGCIGTMAGSDPLCRGVAAHALHAACDDPRFSPLRAEELPRVEIEISVMTPPRPVGDYRAIRLGIDGVVIRDGPAQAVFLPQVAAETGWNLDEFLGNLCLKAGLARNAFRESRTMRFLVFQAQVFAEKDHR
jgi:AmmeMemoRadiSam system protein B/AmmeMemoRadiSam system protein A